MNDRHYVAPALALALLAGCGSSSQNQAAAADARSGSDERDRGSVTRGGETLAGAETGCTVDPVYFDYDSSTLDARSRVTLESDAQCLSRRSGRVVVQGMTDPRGTEEYNFALGEQRARTVQRYLTQLGVDEASTLSMGEERATGEDEAGWARDRRADVVVR